MARDLTAEELVALREHLQAARTPNPIAQHSNILAVLEVLVEALGESADLTLDARKRFDEASGR